MNVREHMPADHLLTSSWYFANGCGRRRPVLLAVLAAGALWSVPISANAAVLWQRSESTQVRNHSMEILHDALAHTTTSPNGYVVSAIQTYAGWKKGGTQCYANQKYTVEYCNVGSSSWLPLTTVDFSPFSSLIDTPASTRVELSAPTGNLLSGVSSLRFTLQVPTRALGTNSGTVLQEIDVIGYPVKTPSRR